MTAQLLSERMTAICRLAPVIPVLVIDDPSDAAPLARALVAGGLPVIEVTLRTPAAVDAIRAMAAVEGAVVGAGTALCGADIIEARAAGAQFAVSPGTTRALLAASEGEDLPILCGTATPTEAMRLLDHGITVAKFFPAAANGGPEALRAWAGPLPRMRFCPTGGVGEDDASEWLALPNVICVGGSWVAPRAAIAAGDWDAITAHARKAADLR